MSERSERGPSTTTDGLARPIDFGARDAAGSARVLVLGGGGIVFVAWQLAYLRGLAERGVQLDGADRVVGTSAGSVVATALVGGRLGRAHWEMETLAKLPKLIGALAPAAELAPSQQRALDLFWTADNARPETIRTIGHAALAAKTPPDATLRRSLALVLARRSWPAASLLITAVDAFSGERLVIRKGSGIPVVRAAAASASVPGLFAPQPLGDRRAMDGGVSGTGTHPDLAAGAERALVLAFGDAGALAIATAPPGGLERDLEALRESGTEVELRTSNLAPDTQLMDPSLVPGALESGTLQAEVDAPALAEFFNR